MAGEAGFYTSAIGGRSKVVGAGIYKYIIYIIVGGCVIIVVVAVIVGIFIYYIYVYIL